MKLISQNVGGNTHAAVEYVNNIKAAEYVLQIDTTASGCNSIVVFRVPDDLDFDKLCVDNLREHYRKERSKS